MFRTVMSEKRIADERDEQVTSHLNEALEIFDRILAELGVEFDPNEEVELDVRTGETQSEAALRAIRASFAESGISEEEFQESGRQIREDLHRKYYGGE
jgi:hypothetical protein